MDFPQGIDDQPSLQKNLNVRLHSSSSKGHMPSHQGFFSVKSVNTPAV
jgi:hypothetical protein